VPDKCNELDLSYSNLRNVAKPSNIFPSLINISDAGPLDNREVLTVIRGVCGCAVQETPGEILCSPNQPTDGYALRLKFSKTDDIAAVELGPLCTPNLVSTIRSNIHANLVQSGPAVVCTKGLFASNELRGCYRYQPPPPSDTAANPDRHTAIQQQLGLKLESTRAPRRGHRH
jgi:hypothetical protein